MILYYCLMTKVDWFRQYYCIFLGGLSELVDMDGQLEAMNQDLEAANELIQVLQQPVAPPAPGAMEGDPDDAQSMVDDSEAPPLDPMDMGSPAASAASGGGGAH
jgi:hypothetical protein